jgi:hypothetical protein
MATGAGSFVGWLVVWPPPEQPANTIASTSTLAAATVKRLFLFFMSHAPPLNFRSDFAFCRVQSPSPAFEFRGTFYIQYILRDFFVNVFSRYISLFLLANK